MNKKIIIGLVLIVAGIAMLLTGINKKINESAEAANLVSTNQPTKISLTNQREKNMPFNSLVMQKGFLLMSILPTRHRSKSPKPGWIR